MSDTNDTILDSDAFPSGAEEQHELYSQNAIRGFSFFFSIIFGGILLSMNLKRAGKEKDIPAVMLLSFGYLALLYLISYAIPLNSNGLSIGLNLAGAYFMSSFVWNKYLGSEVVYHKRSIVTPLLIGLGILTLLVLMIYSTLS